jgi:Ca-activated chloride channel family protein
MDARAAAHVLSEIATLRTLRGEDEAVTAEFEGSSKQLGVQLTRSLSDAMRDGSFPPAVRDVLNELLTDGDSNRGNITPDQAAEIAKNFGIKVYTIGVGRAMFDSPHGVGQ